MSISPDKSAFTACVLGECPPAEKQAFEKALLQNAALREEAVAVSRIAHQLTTALKKEAPKHLTLNQRHTVLNQGVPAATGVSSALSPNTRRATSTPARRAWAGTALATLGVAAALVLGLYLIPSSPTPSPTIQASGSFPAVTIQPATAPRPAGQSPVAPPAVAGSRPHAGLPETSTPAHLVAPETAPAMSANPPTIVVETLPPPSRESSPASQANKPRTATDSLANPAPNAE